MIFTSSLELKKTRWLDNSDSMSHSPVHRIGHVPKSISWWLQTLMNKTFGGCRLVNSKHHMDLMTLLWEGPAQVRSFSKRPGRCISFRFTEHILADQLQWSRFAKCNTSKTLTPGKTLFNDICDTEAIVYKSFWQKFKFWIAFASCSQFFLIFHVVPAHHRHGSLS